MGWAIRRHGRSDMILALRRGLIMHVAVVKATFDEDARVWYVESSDIEGLHVEGTLSRRFAATFRTPPPTSLKATEPGKSTSRSSRTRRSVLALPREGIRQGGPRSIEQGRMLFPAPRKGRSRYLDNPGGKADCRAFPDQFPTHREWHSEGHGPLQGHLRRGTQQPTNVIVRCLIERSKIELQNRPHNRAFFGSGTQLNPRG
jgi:hypothetical protein